MKMYRRSIPSVGKGSVTRQWLTLIVSLKVKFSSLSGQYIDNTHQKPLKCLYPVTQKVQLQAFSLRKPS